jgi:hypothetical protein
LCHDHNSIIPATPTSIIAAAETLTPTAPLAVVGDAPAPLPVCDPVPDPPLVLPVVEADTLVVGAARKRSLDWKV